MKFFPISRLSWSSIEHPGIVIANPKITKLGWQAFSRPITEPKRQEGDARIRQSVAML